jgi:hypothetical protein
MLTAPLCSSVVQAAVEQSTALFDKRARRAETLLLKQCFVSWGAAQYERKEKMTRVIRRMGRLKLTQAWNVRATPQLPPRTPELESRGTCSAPQRDRTVGGMMQCATA